MKSLKILLTNERGCFDAGILALARVLSTRHRVCIVAPLQPNAGIGHALTTAKPLRAEQYFALSKVKIFGVNGTPCDCVGLALSCLLKSKPDLIISGIDSKHNRSETILSSGVTCSSILGTVHGIKSIAVSSDMGEVTNENEFMPMARAVNTLLEGWYNTLQKDTTLNVNFPKKFNLKKIKPTHITTNIVENTYFHEVNPFNQDYYWMKNLPTGYKLDALEDRGDIYWLKQGYITLTPLKYNLTNLDAFNVLEKSKISV
ncbi:MAG: 5'/3'-nucleotidase SurE [Firmicutes bacterium]|nr:5'/3'-nucleotidase SurE [Bacillota bacterium]